MQCGREDRNEGIYLLLDLLTTALDVSVHDIWVNAVRRAFQWAKVTEEILNIANIHHEMYM